MKTVFRVGDYVEVCAISSMQHKKIENQGCKRCVSRWTVTPFRAQITGGCHKQTGRVTGGSYDEQAHLDVDETLFFWCVRRGVTNKEILVQPEDLTLIINPKDKAEPYIPFRHCEVFQVSEKDKKVLREEVKKQPRDSKGRFIKQNLTALVKPITGQAMVVSGVMLMNSLPWTSIGYNSDIYCSYCHRNKDCFGRCRCSYKFDF